MYSKTAPDCAVQTNSRYIGPKNGEEFFESHEQIPLYAAVFTYISFLFLNILGRLQDFLRYYGFLPSLSSGEPTQTAEFVPLYSSYEAFYTRNIYRRAQDCWNRPICSSPGAEIVLVDRVSPDAGWTFNFTGTKTRVLNFGSYNYLGFGDPHGPPVNKTALVTKTYGVGVASTRQEVGSLDLHNELEELLAKFLGVEEAMVFTMGFATNFLNIPCLVDKHCCVISDELNHTSLILGCRLSGATIRRFQHNDMEHLECILQDAIVYGQPRTHRPFKKILIVVEGIYSMEGTIVHLPEVIALKKKYKAYLYLDEAHSIGALGETGRGVSDYFGVDPREVDIMMGTFTKSFGSSGGYLAGSKQLIDYLRVTSHSTAYGSSMPPPVAEQIISALHIMMGSDMPGEGQRRIRQLEENTRYFRARLHQMGLLVYGNRDSPVVPVIICMPAKLVAFSRRCLARGLGVVIVGFPATSLLQSRVRFCISSAHTRLMLDKALHIIKELAGEIGLHYSREPVPDWAVKCLAKYSSHRNGSIHQNGGPVCNGVINHTRKENDKGSRKQTARRRKTNCMGDSRNDSHHY